MNDNGCFEVPLPIVWVLVPVFIGMIGLVFFVAGASYGSKKEAAKCAVITKEVRK